MNRYEVTVEVDGWVWALEVEAFSISQALYRARRTAKFHSVRRPLGEALFSRLTHDCTRTKAEHRADGSFTWIGPDDHPPETLTPARGAFRWRERMVADLGQARLLHEAHEHMERTR